MTLTDRIVITFSLISFAAATLGVWALLFADRADSAIAWIGRGLLALGVFCGAGLFVAILLDVWH